LLHHRPTGIEAEANERRSQAENGRAALFRLRINLALAVRRPRDREQPTPLWRSRCRSSRLVINPSHDDFPALLAEAMDILELKEWDSQAASDFLGCSASQLIKFLKHEPRALARWNEERAKRGLRPFQ
jgi:hypothetical protein